MKNEELKMIHETEDRSKVIVTSGYHEEATIYFQLQNAVIACYKEEYNNQRDFLEWVFEASHNLLIHLKDLDIIKNLLEEKRDTLKSEIDVLVSDKVTLKYAVKIWVDLNLGINDKKEMA